MDDAKLFLHNEPNNARAQKWDRNVPLAAGLGATVKA
jgi:hypothetical protein